MPVSPAAAGRLRRTIRALDEDRQRTGHDRNRSAVPPVPPSHGDPPRSERVPNTNTEARPP